MTIKARLVLRLTVEGRPQRWMRPTEVWSPRLKRKVRITEPVPRAHKKMVAKLARASFKGKPLACPIVLSCRFIFAIPKSWPAKIQAAAREGRIPHIFDPDLDQLKKQIQDALSGIVYIDDNQVWRYHETFKRYGGPERTEIEVYACDQLPDEITGPQRQREARRAQRRLL